MRSGILTYTPFLQCNLGIPFAFTHTHTYTHTITQKCTHMHVYTQDVFSPGHRLTPLPLPSTRRDVLSTTASDDVFVSPPYLGGVRGDDTIDGGQRPPADDFNEINREKLLDHVSSNMLCIRMHTCIPYSWDGIRGAPRYLLHGYYHKHLLAIVQRLTNLTNRHMHGILRMSLHVSAVITFSQS